MERSDIQRRNEDTNEENIKRRIENYAVGLNLEQKMCEESTCLVPPLDTPQSRPQENRRMLLQLTSFCMPTSFQPAVDSAAECQNRGELGGFHNDAINEVSIGKAQGILAVILGLGLAADCAELKILGFILPAAELQLCIGEHKKQWLVSITLLAMAGGSLAWGILGDHLGRRRAMISALSVAALFSIVASVMPTYGTFMTARFCSGLGVSGAFPLSFSYIMEMCPRRYRLRYTGFMHSFWPLGATFIAVASYLTMPSMGADIVQDNREHWSSWHKFLMLSTLPTICCIIGLIWAPESPRYLLEASREVEALAVYQRLHRFNKCSEGYGLTELQLPARNAYRERASPSRNILKNGIASFREVFQFVSCPTHFRRTLLLACVHFLLGFIYMGFLQYAGSTVKQLKDDEYVSHKTVMADANVSGVVFRGVIENQQFRNMSFRNVSFNHVSLVHMQFVDCTLVESEFVDVETSVSFFKNSLVKDSRFIDTDLTPRHFINCTLINNTFMSVTSDCAINFDYNVHIDDLYEDTMVWSLVMALFLVFLAFMSTRKNGSTVSAVLLVVTSSLLVYHVNQENVPLADNDIIIFRLALMCTLSTVSTVVVEGYPCHLRCTAHGTMRSLFHIGCLCAIPIYSVLALESILIPTIVTSVVALVCIPLMRSTVEDDDWSISL